MENKIEVNPDSHVEVTIAKPSKVIYCSDGVVEVFDKEENEELHESPTQIEEPVDPSTMSWGPWLSHHAWKSGAKLLSAVDYAGENLAYFFGITTPKYQIEINEYERVLEEQKKMDEESWVPKNGGGDVPLVMNEPLKSGEWKNEN